MQVSEKWTARLWKQLKSPVVLASLIAVFASGGSGVALWYLENQKTQEGFANDIRGLVTEISDRSHQMLRRVESVEERQDIYKILWGFDPVTNVPYLVVGKYIGQNLYSLVLLLKQKLAQKSNLSEREQEILREAVTSVKYLSYLVSNLPPGTKLGSTISDIYVPNAEGEDADVLKEKTKSALQNIYSLKCFESSPDFVSPANQNPQPC